MWEWAFFSLFQIACLRMGFPKSVPSLTSQGHPTSHLTRRPPGGRGPSLPGLPQGNGRGLQACALRLVSGHGPYSRLFSATGLLPGQVTFFFLQLMLFYYVRFFIFSH